MRFRSFAAVVVFALGAAPAYAQRLCALTAVPAAGALTGSMVVAVDNCTTTQQATLTQLTTFINANGSPNLGAATGTLGAGNGGTGVATLTGVPYANGTSPWTAATSLNVGNLFGCGGSTSLFLRGDGGCAAPAGSGSVTSFSVVSANGFSGSVATANTTPAVTLSTTTSGPLKGSSGALVAASATDIASLFSGTLSSSCFLNGAGACSATAGGGTTSIQSFTIISTSQALSASACFALVDASGGAVTVTLPSASGINHPCAVKRKDNSANTLTINTTGGQTIDGLTSQTIQYQNNGFIFNPDNSGSPNWWTL
jgi:hypothetical protein